MTESNPWAAQWFKAQQQFVDAWSDMAISGAPGNTSQTDLWAQGFDMWRKASGTQAQPDIQQAIDKCMDMGKEYFSMAEQISKSISAGTQPAEAINEWMEQLKQSLQQFGAMPGFDGSAINDFMKQWFNPTSSWQQMAAGLAPMNQTAWQMPGMNTSSFNLGEMIDPLGSMLEAPSVGYFREPQEKQQKGIQLGVAIESIQGFQSRLLKIDTDTAPKSLRGLYDLWVEVSEEHYAEFAMSEEYQDLYGDMVNRLMIVKKHYSEITDDTLRAMNLPNTREVDTMQQRLQQLRRENILLKKEIGEIRSMLQQVVNRPAAAAPAAPAPKKAPRSATTATAASKAPRNSSTAKAAASKAPVKKTVARKAAPKKKPAVTKASKGA